MHVRQDASDEIKTLNRIEACLRNVCNSGMAEFVTAVLPLPLEFHEKFTAAKQALATDPTINADTTLMQVLQRILEEIKPALPPAWMAFAADVGELHSVRRDFMGGSGKVFGNQPAQLEKFLLMRAYYALTLLRDLSNLRKTGFGASVNLLISSLHVDLGKLAASVDAKIAKAQGKVLSPQKDVKDPAKPHPVALLVPGFDVLQCSLLALMLRTVNEQFSLFLTVLHADSSSL